jgi:DNA-binding MarR family transcriptional regulator
VYEPNPRHQRAKLVKPTERGRELLGRISRAQKAWADAHGEAIGEAKLRRAKELVAGIRSKVSMPM